MCLIICQWCRKGLLSLPCLYCQEPERFRKLHPKLFTKYNRIREEAKQKHKCKVKDLKDWIVFQNQVIRELEENELK